jgi:MerR family transcriptional regulator, light-induced transcriptional regulator
MPHTLLTTREAARLLGVGPTSIKRWADSGLIICVKTPGGHRRYDRDSVLAMLGSKTERPAEEPSEARWIELLGRAGPIAEVGDALRRERERTGSWWAVADAMAMVLREVGRRWEAGALTILEEHLISARLMRAVNQCAEEIGVTAGAPACLLLTAAGEDHTLPLALAELCLREAGWSARWAGRRTPLDQTASFVASGAVRMLIVSGTAYSSDEASLALQAQTLGAACRAAGVRLVLAGSARWPTHLAYGDRLTSFGEFGRYLAAR